MITVSKFVFNPFQENTFLLYDETGACVILDPGCYDPAEKESLQQFIEAKKLKPERLLYTHCHVDHILGNNFICDTYGLKPEMHPESLPFFEKGPRQGEVYGFQLDAVRGPASFINHGDQVTFGDSVLKAVYTPGHVDGSLCFICEAQKFVITGDVLFKDSIGRTDFPTGDFDLLMNSIHTHLFTLDDAYTVYCGHGPETSIGYEKVNNPFIRF